MYQILTIYGDKDSLNIVKESAKFKVEGFDGEVEYLAAPLVEKFTFKDADGNGVGVIYTKKKLDKTLNMEIEHSEVAGAVDEFTYLATFTSDDVSKVVEFEWDLKAKGSQARPKKLKTSNGDLELNYRPLIQESGIHLEPGVIEATLYQSPSYEEVSQDKDLSWITRLNKEYKVLITKEDTLDYINLLKGLDRETTLLSIDTETTGLRADRLRTDEIVGISLSHKTHFGVYIPLQQKFGKNNEFTIDEIMELLKPFISVDALDTNFKLIGHNLSFDWKVFKMYGIELNIVHDTYVMMSLIHWSRNTFIRALKASIEHYFGIDVLELNEMFTSLTAKEFEKVKDLGLKDSNIDPLTRRKLTIAKNHGDMLDFRYAPEWFYTLYGPADGDFPLWLYDELTKADGDWTSFDGKLDFTYQLELQVIPAFEEQEFYGIRFLSEGVEHLKEDAIKKRDAIEQQIYELVGHEFLISSSLQLGKVLFEEMGCPQLPKFMNKKSGQWKTDKGTMERLAGYRNEDGSEKFPIVHLLNDYSKIDHAINSFYNNLPLLERGGYLFPQYSQLGAATGRVTCKDPNVQQMYPAVRSYVVPDSDDYYFAICDFSQIERRVMGGMSGDPGIVDRFNSDPEADSHIQTYAQMTGTPYEKVTSSQRKIGKILNFATAYGVGDEKLAMNVFKKDDAAHQAQAADLRKAYFDSVPILEAYLEEKRDQAEIDGYASTYFGRQRYIKEFNYDTIKEHTREKGRRAAGNMVIQGTAADILKLALVRLRHTFREFGYYEDKISIRMNVHDEVTVCVHKSVHPFIVCKLMKEAMELDLSEYGFPPFYAGMNVGMCWKDGKRDDLEAQVLLMEEMRVAATKHLEDGTPLPDFSMDDDIIEWWLAQIKDFSLRQLVQEVELGYIDTEGNRQPINNLDDAHSNPRIAKYSGYFGSVSQPVWDDFLIMEAINTPDVEYLEANWDDIVSYNTHHLKEAIKYINQERPTKVTEGNIWRLSYFAFGLDEVLTKLQHNPSIELTGIDRKGWSNVATFSDGSKVVLSDNKGETLQYPKVFVPGQEVDGDALTVEELIVRDLSLVGDLYTFNMTNMDAEFLSFLETILLPTHIASDLGVSGSSIIVTLPAGTEYRINGILLDEFVDLFIEGLISFYCGDSYEPLLEKLDRMQEEFLSKFA